MVVSAAPARLRLGIVKFASCDGCQLSLLGLEDELLDVAERFEIVEFPEASSLRSRGPYDVLLVEGSISAADQAAEIVELREQARLLVTIGACANTGGIQALRNWTSEQSFRAAVYPSPEYIDSLATATPVSEHVHVDASLPGCPISAGQLREVLASIAIGRRPQIREESVCIECKRRGTTCILVSSGTPCLGPVTQAGCGAICPAFGRGCYACFGPKEAANAASLGGSFVGAGRDPADVGRLFAGFTAYAEPFRTQVTERRYSVGYLTRVEGEGSLLLRVRDGEVLEARFKIFEAPRYFEQLVVGRTPDEVIDIVARICGICPVAYQMSAVHAFEDCFGVTIEPAVRSLRRLLYCGEWIESHALHIYLLHAPDFLGYPSALAMAADHREAVARGLAIKKLGNQILEVLGGRAIHPVSVRVGGFSRVPRRSELEALRPALDEAVRMARETIDFVVSLEAPELDRPMRYVALRHAAEYPYNDGRIVSTDGIDVAPSRWDDAFVEVQVEGTNALHARTAEAHEVYLVGPAARITLAADRLHPLAAAALAETGLAERIRTNVYWSIAARAVELLHALAEARDIIDAYRMPSAAHVAWRPSPGRAAWATEAPRGLLFHRYEVDGEGRVTAAQIVPPTSQNQGAIEADLVAFAPRVLDLPHAEAQHRIEQLVRSYDPCISCATHFLDLRIEEVP